MGQGVKNKGYKSRGTSSDGTCRKLNFKITVGTDVIRGVVGSVAEEQAGASSQQVLHGEHGLSQMH